MINLPFGIAFDVTSLLAGISLTAIAGWISSFFALRKDERTIQIDQITKERTKWRDRMRDISAEIAMTYFENRIQLSPGGVAKLRAKLATSINPKDILDNEILSHFDDLFSGKRSNLEAFANRIALLLKHDWERVKWECTPIYWKFCTRYTKEQRAWRKPEYRHLSP